MTVRPRLAAVFLLSAAGLIAGLAACGEKTQSPAPAASNLPALTVAAAEVDDLKPVAATLTSYRMAQATARLAGVLTSLDVREGDTVRAGQRIGFVQDSRIAPQTSAYAAAAAAADAQAVQAQAQYNRVKTLYDKGIYARAALDQADAARKAAEADVRAARAQTANSAGSTDSSYGDRRNSGHVGSPTGASGRDEREGLLLSR